LAGEHTRGGCYGLIESNVRNITWSDGRMKVRLKTLLDKPRGGAWRSSVRGVNCPVKSGKQPSGAMRIKLKPEICYVAGIYSKVDSSSSKIELRTESSAVEERFIEIAIKSLGILPERVIAEGTRKRNIYFYHSKMAKQLRYIISNETRLFKKRDANAASFVAGMFDAAGRVSNGMLSIEGLTGSDQVMLENLGIYTEGKRIRNISSFITLIHGFSVLLEHIQLPGNERDPH